MSWSIQFPSQASRYLGLSVVSRTGVLLHEKDKEKTKPLPGKYASGYGGSRDFVLNTSGISGL